MTVGDIVYRKISFGTEAGVSDRPPQRGVVVYIHPRRWFYRVEFSFPWNGIERRFTESYPLRAHIPADEGKKDETPREKQKHPRGATAQARKPLEQGKYFPATPQKRKSESKTKK